MTPEERSPVLSKPCLRGSARLARLYAVNSLTQRACQFKVVYNSPSLAGQLAAVEGGLAIAAITQCTVSASLQVLGSEHGLGSIEPMEVSILRSRASCGSKAVNSLHALIICALRHRGQARRNPLRASAKKNGSVAYHLIQRLFKGADPALDIVQRFEAEQAVAKSLEVGGSSLCNGMEAGICSSVFAKLNQITSHIMGL